MKKLLSSCCILLSIFACSNRNEHVTENGLRYVLHVEKGGKKPQKGDYVTMELVCHTDDTTLIDTRKLGSPFRFQLEKIPFAGSYEEGLMLLGEGDSATFFVSADSLYHSIFGENDSIPQEETKMKKGGTILYDVKILKVQNYVEAEQEMQVRFAKMEKEEMRVLADFISRNKITDAPDSSGLYKIMTMKGNGPAVDTGKVISVYYRGRLMDGTIFNSTQKDKPTYFVPGRSQVINGWEIAFKDAHVGDRFSLIMPSKLAYGEEGLKDPATGKFIVPPYSSLIFDIAVAAVTASPVAAKK